MNVCSFYQKERRRRNLGILIFHFHKFNVNLLCKKIRTLNSEGKKYSMAPFVLITKFGITKLKLPISYFSGYC